jgi:serine/threonine-protein kinase
MFEISGYELLEKIGEGGMATVWRARQLSLDRIVAIKVLGKTSLPDQEARDRFRREAQTAARLNHPNIVQVFDTGELDNSAYLVMEFVDGKTVGDLIEQNATLPESKALEIIEFVARALAYAWEKECIIHCDIKPDNILIDHHTGVVKVADLGLARMIGFLQADHDNDLIIGTPNYTSPEQSRGVPDLDCRTDMYSLGAMLYHMVTGVMPFRDATGSQAMTRHEEDFLDDPQTINPDVSAPAAWLIEKLMIKNRALRPHFWTQTIKDIEEVRRGHLPNPPLPGEGTSTVRRSTSRTAVKHTAAKVVLTVPPGGPKKLTIKKADVPAPLPVRRESGMVGRALRNLIVLIFLAAAVYGVLLYQGKVKGPPLPFIPKPEEETSEPVVEEPTPGIGEVAPTVSAPEPWRNEDFIQGAKLFNQALAAYNAYQKTRTHPGALREVEEGARDAISYFEACRDSAPEHVNVGSYIDQCYGLIADVRGSTQLGNETQKPSPSQGTSDMKVQRAEDATATRTIEYINDEPDVQVGATPPPVDEKLLRVSLGSGWNIPASGSDVFALEFGRLMSRHVSPTRSMEVDAKVVLYPGINCMMTARDASKVLKKELPIRRQLNTPGFPSTGLFAYQFTGDFSGAKELTLVVDLNDRVVMAQLFDDREVPAKMEAAIFSSNWSVYDFVGAKKRGESDGLIAHRVRKNMNLIRLDTELESSNGSRLVKARVALMMPAQITGIILQANTPSR